MNPSLPASVQEIADVIGVELAMRLVGGLPRSARKCHPGGRPYLYVPKVCRPDHPITIIIGMDAAEKLSRALGGEGFLLATCADMVRRHRNAAIAAAVADGATTSEVCATFGLRPRQAQYITRAMADVCRKRDAAQHPAHSAIAVNA